jgi:anti-sigma factor RsiW
MTKSNKSISCSLTQAKIEAYLDAELSRKEAAEVESHLSECQVCTAELARAKEVRSTLRELPEVSCPDRVTRAVLAQARADLRSEHRRRLRDWLSTWTAPAWRPALATATLVALLATALLVGRREESPPAVSPEELARAEVEVKWTLAYLGEMGRRAGFLVREEVIESQVVEPVKRAVETLSETDSVQ